MKPLKLEVPKPLILRCEKMILHDGDSESNYKRNTDFPINVYFRGYFVHGFIHPQIILCLMKIQY